jgi:hypothetical protein
MSDVRGAARATTDHETIRNWVEDRGGHPATVRRTGDEEDPGILRIDYPGYSGERSLEPISWDAFFEKFDEKRLAFLYQDETVEGEPSRFSKLVDRDTVRDQIDD